MNWLDRWHHPETREIRALLDARWNELPASLQVPHQALGRQLVHCGYTMGPSYCSFGCTHCYLPANANRVPLPSLDELEDQIDANRRLMGATGGLQITGGDVVDAYWRADRIDELVEIVRYAIAAGVAPMVMTHGQVLLDHPDVLDRLVVEGGLRKLAIHIDITQAGRPDYPIRSLTSEVDLHPLRQRFVDLILDCQERTGTRFYAAHTVTVTERNIDSIAEIPRWLLAERRRLDAFRMVSFQTEAAVGRTRMSTSPVTPETTWAAVCDGVGLDLERDNMLVGHPDCSNMTTVMALFPERRVLNLMPGDAESRALIGRFLETFRRVGTRDRTRVLRLTAMLARRPSLIVAGWRYLRTRLRRERLGLWTLSRRVLRGEAGFLNIVLHNFMDSATVAAALDDAEHPAADRLAACSFRGAARRDGEWRAVPMCAMNAGEREARYADAIGAQLPPGRPGSVQDRTASSSSSRTSVTAKSSPARR